MSTYHAFIEIHQDNDRQEFVETLKQLGWEAVSAQRGIFKIESQDAIGKVFDDATKAASSPGRPAKVLVIESGRTLDNWSQR